MGGMDDPMGIDAANDPELAMALRISLEEQRARQQQVFIRMNIYSRILIAQSFWRS